MTDHKNDDNLNEVLGQVAYQMKETMDTMYAALQRVAPGDARDADGELDENAAMLTRNFYRLRRLSGNLEEAANLDSPVSPPQQNDDIIGLCAQVTERAAHAAKLLGLTLEFKSGRSSHIIALDAVRIERLLLNLLSNAFKFTPAGGKVTVEMNVMPQHVELRVTDTGCGITREQKEHLFDRYRSASFPDGSPRGLGLGLPICRKIAADHGGTLVVVSDEGNGTAVTVTLENKKSVMLRLNTWMAGDYAGGFNRTLLELSDALPKQAFKNRMMD